MPQLAAGSTVTIPLAERDGITISTRGTARLVAVGGLGMSPQAIAEFSGTRTFGGYPAGTVTLTAGGGQPCQYDIGDATPSGLTTTRPGATLLGTACAVGDSHIKNGFSFSANATMLQQSGWIAWLMAFTSHQIWLPWGVSNTGTELGGCMLAVSGTTTVDLINNQLTRASMLRTGFVFVSTGGNDLVAFPNDDVYTITTRLKTIIDTLADSGKCVVMPTLSPRAAAGAAGWSSTALSAPQITAAIQKQLAINQWLRDYARNQKSLVLVDDYWRLVDTSSATGDPLATMVSDGLHLSAMGSFIRAQVALAALAGRYRPIGSLGTSLADSYNATNNITGNHAPNSTLQGTGGTAGTGMTGTVATSYTIDRDGGTDTATVTAQARADGLNGREQLIAVTSTGGKVRMYPTALITPGNFSGGDYFFFEVEVSVNSVGGNGQWQGLDMFSWQQGGAVNTQQQFLTPTGAEQVPATAWTGTLRTPIGQISAGANSLLCYPRINGVNGGNPNVTIRRPRYQKVDPSLMGILQPGADF